MAPPARIRSAAPAKLSNNPVSVASFLAYSASETPRLWRSAQPGPHQLARFRADSTLAAAAWWIMIYDAITKPAAGAVTPAKCYALPSSVTSAAYAFPAAVSFTTGIVIGVSTTGCFTKTASTHAFISGDYQ